MWVRLGSIVTVLSRVCLSRPVLYHRSLCWPVKGSRWCTAFYGKYISEIRSVTCHMGLCSVICHSTQVNALHLNSSHTSWYSIYIPQMDGRLSSP